LGHMDLLESQEYLAHQVQTDALERRENEVFPVETDLMGLRAKTDFQASELERGEVLVPSETLEILVQGVALEILEFLDRRALAVNQVMMENQENVDRKERQELLEMTVIQEKMVSKVTKETQVQLEIKEREETLVELAILDPVVHPVLKVLEENQVYLVSMEGPEPTGRLDHQEVVGSQVGLE